MRERVYLEAMYRAYFESSTKFDRSIELISTGALLISFAYMGEVIPYASASAKNWLVGSWVLFIATILVALLSHSQAVREHRRAISQMDDPQPGGWLSVNLLNRLSIALLILGLIAMFMYISLNLL